MVFLNHEIASEFNVGDNVKHKHRDNMTGPIVKVLKGCNCLYEVDFGQEFISLVPSQDIEKIN
jgi:hypothetical protein